MSNNNNDTLRRSGKTYYILCQHFGHMLIPIYRRLWDTLVLLDESKRNAQKSDGQSVGTRYPIPFPYTTYLRCHIDTVIERSYRWASRVWPVSCCKYIHTCMYRYICTYIRDGENLLEQAQLASRCLGLSASIGSQLIDNMIRTWTEYRHTLASSPQGGHVPLIAAPINSSLFKNADSQPYLNDDIVATTEDSSPTHVS